jgi:uracil-DNA glycosylase
VRYQSYKVRWFKFGFFSCTKEKTLRTLFETKQMEIPIAWQPFLEEEVQKPYFHELQKAVAQEYTQNTCYPPKDLIFEALKQCSPDNLKVVIIGQDPYHGAGEANGLCFSVNEQVPIPPSLRNIFREMCMDLDLIFQPSSGRLDHWARQGVLLLNATLTVRANQANSHHHLSWQRFTDTLIQKIATEKENIVFLLWGSFAMKKGEKIDKNRHLVLTSGHPSPLSANQGKWFGNKHFSKTNDFLKSIHKEPIDWFTS